MDNVHLDHYHKTNNLLHSMRRCMRFRMTGRPHNEMTGHDARRPMNYGVMQFSVVLDRSAVILVRP
jgi:hypothetical protein